MIIATLIIPDGYDVPVELVTRRRGDHVWYELEASGGWEIAAPPFDSIEEAEEYVREMEELRPINR